MKTTMENKQWEKEFPHINWQSFRDANIVISRKSNLRRVFMVKYDFKKSKAVSPVYTWYPRSGKIREEGVLLELRYKTAEAVISFITL